MGNRKKAVLCLMVPAIFTNITGKTAAAAVSSSARTELPLGHLGFVFAVDG